MTYLTHNLDKNCLYILDIQPIILRPLLNYKDCLSNMDKLEKEDMALVFL